MFTGIVADIGRVVAAVPREDGIRLEINCGEKIKDNLSLGDSVSVNGACLSVVYIGNYVSFDVVQNTLKNTTIKRLKKGDKVNLENAMSVGDKISGHIVSGHVDGERIIKKNARGPRGWELDILIEPGDKKFLIQKGSVAVDGVSLTVSEIFSDHFRIFLIPITIKDTILKLKKCGDYVNVEFDMTAKYNNSGNTPSVNDDLLRRTGFMS